MKKRLIKILAIAIILVTVLAPLNMTAVGASDFTPSQKYPLAGIEAKIAAAQKVNAGIKGWLIVPGTTIDEPVAFSSKSNTYYLYRDANGKEYPIQYSNWTAYPDTVSYLDYRTKFGQTWGSSSKNHVIYNHNWDNFSSPLKIGKSTNRKMFGQLPYYTSKEFLEKNPYIYYSENGKEGIWKIFAVGYTIDGAGFDYISANPSNEKYLKILKEWRARSLFDTGVALSGSDKILTLSTCTRVYGASDTQRFVVVARLLRSGESDTDPVTVTARNAPSPYTKLTIN